MSLWIIANSVSSATASQDFSEKKSIWFKCNKLQSSKVWIFHLHFLESRFIKYYKHIFVQLVCFLMFMVYLASNNVTLQLKSSSFCVGDVAIAFNNFDSQQKNRWLLWQINVDDINILPAPVFRKEWECLPCLSPYIWMDCFLVMFVWINTLANSHF